MPNVNDMIKQIMSKADLCNILRRDSERELWTVLDKIALLRKQIKEFIALEKISSEQRKLAVKSLEILEKNIQSINYKLFEWQNDIEAVKSLVNNLTSIKKKFESIYPKQPTDWSALCEIENDLKSKYKILSFYLLLNSFPDNHSLQRLKIDYAQYLKQIRKKILTAAYKATPNRMSRIPNHICSFTTHINQKNAKGRTLLHEAVLDGDGELVVLLVENGADTNIRESIDNYPYGYHPTPLDTAIERNHVNITLYLLSVSAHKQFYDGMSLDDKLINKEFKDACYKNRVNKLQDIIKKCKENQIQLDPSAIFIGMVLATHQGFEKIIKECLSLKIFNDFEKSILIETCLEHGYPQLLNLLQCHGFSITKHQHIMSSALSLARSSGFGGDAYINHRDHKHNSQNGDNNEKLYQTEFRDMVAYVKYYIMQNKGSFFQLIENLGVRRLRQAQITRLNSDIIEWYGKPTDREMNTPYASIFTEYEEKIHARYDKNKLRRDGIQVEIHLNGRPVPLTKITNSHWYHPNGENRAEILAHVDKLCQKLHSTRYDEPKVFAKDLAEIYWILSHAPPILRGIRTVIEALADAFWEIKFPLLRREKKFDLNCEALVFDKCEDYQKFFVEHIGILPNDDLKVAVVNGNPSWAIDSKELITAKKNSIAFCNLFATSEKIEQAQKSESPKLPNKRMTR